MTFVHLHEMEQDHDLGNRRKNLSKNELPRNIFWARASMLVFDTTENFLIDLIYRKHCFCLFQLLIRKKNLFNVKLVL